MREPHGEANQTGGHAVAEAQLRFRELSTRIALLVDDELDSDVCLAGVGRGHLALQANHAVVVPSCPEEPTQHSHWKT